MWAPGRNFDCSCGAENFFDIARARQEIDLEPCWSCGNALTFPPRMRIGGANDFKLVALSSGTRLFAHHLEADTYNFTAPLAEVISRPLGLKNLSGSKWTSQTDSGATTDVPSHTVLPLSTNCHIHFGKTTAEVKL
jgi:hypothetical protein